MSYYNQPEYIGTETETETDTDAGTSRYDDSLRDSPAGEDDLEPFQHSLESTCIALRFRLRMPSLSVVPHARTTATQTIQLCFHPPWTRQNEDNMVQVDFAARDRVRVGNCRTNSLEGHGSGLPMTVLEMESIDLDHLFRLHSLRLQEGHADRAGAGAGAGSTSSRATPPSPSLSYGRRALQRIQVASRPSPSPSPSPSPPPRNMHATLAPSPGLGDDGSSQRRGLVVVAAAAASFLLGILVGLVTSLICATALWTWWQDPLRAHLDAASSALQSRVELYITGPSCPNAPLHASASSLAVEAVQAAMPLLTIHSSTTSTQGEGTLGPRSTSRSADSLAFELHTDLHDLCLYAPNAPGRHDLVTLCQDSNAALAHAVNLLSDVVSEALPAYVREATDCVFSMARELQYIDDQLTAAGGDGAVMPSASHQPPLAQGQQPPHNTTSAALVGACLYRLELWREKHGRLADPLGQALRYLRAAKTHEDRIVDGFEYEAAKKKSFSQNVRIDMAVREALGVLRRRHLPAMVTSSSTSTSTILLSVVESVVASLGQLDARIQKLQVDGSVVLERSIYQHPQRRWWPSLLRPGQCHFPAILDMRWDLQRPENELKTLSKMLKQ